MRSKKFATPVRLSHLTLAKVIGQLLSGPSTAHEVVEASGLRVDTAYKFLHAMRKYKVAHISAWDIDSMGRDVTPVFTLGVGKDAPRRKMTPAQSSKAYRDRRRMRMIEGNLGFHHKHSSETAA